jgi:hypothetical protein
MMIMDFVIMNFVKSKELPKCDDLLLQKLLVFVQQGDNSMEIFWLFNIAAALPIQHF